MQNNLLDPFGRNIEYLRLSVTDRCDLRCTYCMPKRHRNFEEPEDWLTFDEIERLVAAFGRLGLRRLRITGGEPLVRKHLSQLASRLANQAGIEDLSLSTNAIRLERFASDLKQAGVQRINVSLDSLNPDTYREITGGGKLKKALAGLAAAADAGIQPIKINMVVMKSINDHEVESMIDFCHEHNFTLRLIETMPVGNTGRAATDLFVDLRTIQSRLARRYDLIPCAMPGGGPASYVQIAGTSLKIGFITPLSQHFCATCNRVRLTVDGTLLLCLGQENKFEFRPLLRANATDDDLEAAIGAAIALKPERHEFLERPEKVVRFMSMTGG